MLSSSSPIILLVDGYNIIGAWPKLRQLASRSAMDLARVRLVEMLSSFVAFRGYQTTVIFDAYIHQTPAHQESSASGIEIYYTAYGETADTVIERYCAQLEWEDCRVRVATSDRMEQLVVAGFGAEWLSAQQLQEELKRAAEEIRRAHARKRPKPKRGIDRYLDAHTLERLQQWRITGQAPNSDPCQIAGHAPVD